MLCRKTANQSYSPSAEVLSLMKDFKDMTNECVRIGLDCDTSTLKRLSLLSYRNLARFRVPSYYKLSSISRATGILASRRKSIKRGRQTKTPYQKKLMLTCCYHLRIVNGALSIPTRSGKREELLLTKHTLDILSDPSLKVNSFTLTPTSLSISYSKDVKEMSDPLSAAGVDRNLRNLTVGDGRMVTCYIMAKIVDISYVTTKVASSFKRNDVRLRSKITSKYGRRRSSRVRSILHKISKLVVLGALRNKEIISLEDIHFIRGLYQRGNGQGSLYRGFMNSWPYAEIERQIDYKAAWAGVPVMHLTKAETRGTSSSCYRCGERLQGTARDDVQHYRQLWCPKCGMWFDRDLVAVMNISRKGWVRFAHSEGEAVDPMTSVNGEGTYPEGNEQKVILCRHRRTREGIRGCRP